MSDRITRMEQAKIYIGKCFRIFFNSKGYMSFVTAAIITGIIALVTGEDTFLAYRDTKNGAFSLVCACIWIGIFNSIQSICRERAIIKREYRTGLHISSYVIAHLVYEFILCVAEALVVTIIISLFHGERIADLSGAILPGFIELFVTFVIVIFSSDALGILVSSIVKNENMAMTVMPFILIIQLVLSGSIFELEGASEIIAYFTISKWGLDSICATSDINSMIGPLETTTGITELEQYAHEPGNMIQCWFIMIAFALLYGLLSVMFLKLVDRDKR